MTLAFTLASAIVRSQTRASSNPISFLDWRPTRAQRILSPYRSIQRFFKLTNAALHPKSSSAMIADKATRRRTRASSLTC
ncbi:unnamed protein product, partial [Mycena citricolor]